MSAVNEKKLGRRRAQAMATRTHIIDTAAQLFNSDGYLGTTIETIAETAGVAVQTIYNCVGSKAALLGEVLARSTEDAETLGSLVALVKRDAALNSSPGDLVAMLADWLTASNKKSVSAFALLEEAGSVDDKVRKQERKRAREQLDRYAEIASVLRALGGLVGVSEKEAAATLFALGHPRVYRDLVTEGDRPEAAYRRWLANALSRALG
jgi:AcrR family transcriptional regulator